MYSRSEPICTICMDFEVSLRALRGNLIGKIIIHFSLMRLPRRCAPRNDTWMRLSRRNAPGNDMEWRHFQFFFTPDSNCPMMTREILR